MSAYALGQVGRNGIDFIRVLNRNVDMDSGLTKAQKAELLLIPTLTLMQHDDISKIGKLKIEKIIKSQRKVYAVIF